ncbi:hypothetical protein ACJ73_06307 [Blastomyces percursus]|uniref:Myb-like domain-containing protein n=1 Tax=Blastomyces percursus TaxID=1658174 RepID=A0A1J9QQ72_9EURO|nr:hypothetical protein ACJ73_06307 [Blastomyces percursus]
MPRSYHARIPLEIPDSEDESIASIPVGLVYQKQNSRSIPSSPPLPRKTPSVEAQQEQTASSAGKSQQGQAQQSSRAQKSGQTSQVRYERVIPESKSIHQGCDSSLLPVVPTLHHSAGTATAAFRRDSYPAVIDLTQDDDGAPGEMVRDSQSQFVLTPTRTKTERGAAPHGHRTQGQASGRSGGSSLRSSQSHLGRSPGSQTSSRLQGSMPQTAGRQRHPSSRAERSSDRERPRRPSEESHASVDLDSNSNPDFPSVESLMQRCRGSSQGSSLARLPSVGTMADEYSVGYTSYLDQIETRIAAAAADIEAMDDIEAPAYSRNARRRRRQPWTDQELEYLVEQVNHHGAAWQVIWEQNQTGPRAIHPRRTPVDYKDKAIIYKRDQLMYVL